MCSYAHTANSAKKKTKKQKNNNHRNQKRRIREVRAHVSHETQSVRGWNRGITHFDMKSPQLAHRVQDAVTLIGYAIEFVELIYFIFFKSKMYFLIKSKSLWICWKQWLRISFFFFLHFNSHVTTWLSRPFFLTCKKMRGMTLSL